MISLFSESRFLGDPDLHSEKIDVIEDGAAIKQHHNK